ncbi:MAG: ribonuclease III [Elusimicrobia bacterium]|nr:ribonuclease III [Elusimicrobiota bacterium]
MILNNNDILQKKIGVKFKNINFLNIALTHKSYAVENNLKEFNERMEFLGDAILSAATVVYLYQKYPNFNEGKLSKMKSSAVSRTTLNLIARKYDISKFVKISKSEEATGGREKESILANTMESIIGAIFLDKGYKTAEKFVHVVLNKHGITTSDYKSELQEIIQSKYKLIPNYSVIEEKGPDHDKIFKMAVFIDKKQLGTGFGKSKKEAEQNAAKNVLSKI